MSFLSAVGFLMIAVIIYLLLKGKSSPIVVMIIVPIISAVLIGTNLDDLGSFVSGGISTVTNNAVLFIFSIIFFGVMSDLGVFDILVNGLIKISGDNVVAIMVATGIIGIIAHMDGATATTVLITIPAMYPIYKRMGIRTEILLCLTAAAMGVMNLLPWGGPVARAAAVLGMEATDLWITLIPVQIFGVVVTIILSIFLGVKEKRRLGQVSQVVVADAGGVGFDVKVDNGAAGVTTSEDTQIDDAPMDTDQDAPQGRNLLLFNALWTVAVIGILVWDKFPSYMVFMVGLSVTLIANYPSLKEQNEMISKHAGSALQISATMLAAGVMVGVMDGTGMIEAIAVTLTDIIPNALGQFTHLIFGFTALPMGMMIGTDAYFFGLMPPILEVGAQFGVDPTNTAMTMLIGKNLSLMISPLVPATFLALGLVDIDLKEHIKFSMKYLYIASIAMILFALAIGIITL